MEYALMVTLVSLIAGLGRLCSWQRSEHQVRIRQYVPNQQQRDKLLIAPAVRFICFAA
jgi:hypothetical protein